MMLDRRFALTAAAGTLALAALPRKPLAEELPPLTRGLTKIDPPEAIPAIPFLDANAGQHFFADFKGRGMVVNLWATWCAPCVAEMPALDALSRALAPADIAVLPLSSDRGGADNVRAWFQAHDIGALPILLDPKGAIARAFGSNGIPTTVIVGKAGKAVARLEGAADWGTPEAAILIQALVG
jgi:thiol-disulfide isomerase/thioredoxin